MRTNPVKKALQAGGSAIGTMVLEFATTGIARIAGAAGADFVLFDMEHTALSIETMRTVLASCRPDGPAPLVRVPAAEYHFLARILDAGAMGVMVPMVESAEQAQVIAQATKYPPIGRGGAAFGVAHDDYRPGDAIEKMRSANEKVLVIAQIETARGLEHLEAIAGQAGIDVLWIGHNDLTNSLGIPGQFTHPRYLEAVAQVLDAARRHGKAAGFMATDTAIGKAALAQGFRMVAYAGDIWIYQQALRAGIASLRGH